MTIADPTDDEAACELARSICATDCEALTLISEARARAEKAAGDPSFRSAVGRVANALLERRVLDGDELTELMEVPDDEGDE
jgi:hypothetical protein